MSKLVLALLYNGVWAAAVFGGAAGSSWPGVGAALLFLAGIAWWRGGADARWLGFLLGCALFGAVADGALTQAGLLEFPGEPEAWPLPLWMPALWMAFSGILGPVFTFLYGRPWISAVVGGVAGPVTYAGAAKFGGAAFAEGWLPVAGVALEWALFLPPAMAVAARLERARVARGVGAASPAAG